MKTNLGSVCLLVLAACGGGAAGNGGGGQGTAADDSGLPTENGDGGSASGEGGSAAQGDGGGGVVTGGADGGGCGAKGDSGAGDPPDDMGVDSNCDGADGVVGRDVYVDANTGLDSNDGSPKMPLATITAALRLASSRQGSVLVDGGTFTDASLSAPGNWAIYGGYAPSFVGAPQRALTILTPTATGLLAEQGSTVKLAHLTIQPQPPQQAGMAASVYGVRSSVTTLDLDDVAIQTPLAAGGTDGSPGAEGSAGSQGTTCGSAPKPSYSVGALPGIASPDGTTSAGHFSPTTSLALQATGGFAGTDGSDAPGTLVIKAGFISPGVGTSGGSDGTPGYGGAGGASGTCTPTGETAVLVYGGHGGRGGCPAEGGSGAVSGGSSVGVLVLAGSVNITRSSVTAGLGGDGGNGGDGGAGGLGGNGGVPTSSSGPAFPTSCHDASNPLCAAYGGQGGNGGAGGRGGGGAGGWSVGVLTASGAHATVDGSTTVTTAKGGLGGVGNGGTRAAQGQAHGEYSMP